MATITENRATTDNEIETYMAAHAAGKLTWAEYLWAVAQTREGWDTASEYEIEYLVARLEGLSQSRAHQRAFADVTSRQDAEWARAA